MISITSKLWLSIPLLIILAACAGTPESSIPTATLTAAAERELATELPSIELSSEELPDDVATRYMYELSSRDRESGGAALEAVLGELVEEELELELLPVVLTSWEDWLAQHPDTQVLGLVTGYERFYLPGAAHADYFSSTSSMFPVWHRGDQLDTKDRIYALRIEGAPKAYPINNILIEGVVNGELAGTNVVLVANRGPISVRGENRRVGPVVYDAGGEVRAFDRGDEQFSATGDPDVVVDSQGREWQVTEEALVGPDGETAARINGHLAYWFGWFAFFPNTLVYGSEPGEG